MDGTLPGGNMNDVRRVGDTVHRVAGPWTPTIHRLLAHVVDRGVAWVPKPLGMDDTTEVVSFIEGDVPEYPLPDYVWSEHALTEGARMLRQLHDASIDFDRTDATWQQPSREPDEVICPNDFAPHNLVFRDGHVIGAIDFDMASPGSRLWDIAYFATRIVPLTRDHPDGAPPESASHRRVQLILDAYGSEASWTDVIRIAIVRLRELAEFSLRKADELGKPALRDDAELYLRDARYLDGTLRSAG